MSAFVPTDAAGVCLIQLDAHHDSRGHFARTWSIDDFQAAGLAFLPVEASTSTTIKRGTIRGMHFQRPPREEAKLVRCSRGRIWDVITDLRPASATYTKSFGFEIGSGAFTAIFVPAGFAHGYQTLTDDVQVEYMMNERYAPALADGFRHDDSSTAIAWPLPATIVSDRDLAWPPLASREFWHEEVAQARNRETVR